MSNLESSWFANVESVCTAEISARAANGLPGQHVLDMTQFPFAFATDALSDLLLMADAWFSIEGTPGAALAVAMARLAMCDYSGADAVMVTLETLQPSHPMAQMRFAARYPCKPVKLPQVKHSWPITPSFFVSCDANYLAYFAKPLIRSLLATGSRAPLHIHLIDGQLKDVAALRALRLPITCTTEDAAPFIKAHNITPNTYYNAIRMIRFAEALDACAQALVMVDIDSLVVSNPDALLSSPVPAIRVRPGRIEPWH